MSLKFVLISLRTMNATLWVWNRNVEKVCRTLASRIKQHIAVLRKITGFLPLSRRLQYYNAVFRPVMSFSDVI